jgi:aspartate racemase
MAHSMKTIGLIGGMSWESTVVYYQLLNRMTRDRIGGLHSAKLLLWSFDFAEIEGYQHSGDWDAAAAALASAAQKLELGGAQCIVICTNTMHKLADQVRRAVRAPLIHIGDAAAHAVLERKVRNPLLLATRYTMEQDFYTGYLREKHGVKVVIPQKPERDIVHAIIYEELCRGIVSPQSRQRYLDIVAQHVKRGADGVIFGCTEVGLLISQQDFDVPVFDTTELHVRAALDFALAT